MKQTSTKVWVPFKKCLVLILTIFGLSFSQSSFAHRVEMYTTSGCASGQNVTIDAVISNAPSVTWYSWQYKDATGVWKCFINGSNVINGVSFTVSGAKGTGANNAPLLTINGATSALEDVQIRVLMRENAEPCGAPAGTTYGGDDLNLSEVKVLRLHIYSPAGDCGNTTPGCIGNVLANAAGYYGGFENKVYNTASADFTDNNFIAGAGSTQYTISQPTSALPATSGTGTAQIWNNPYTMHNSNTKFAPHTGNFQMIIQGSANTQRKAWYKTVTVTPGATYAFSVWVARTQGNKAYNLKLTANGTDLITAAVSTTLGVWNQINSQYTVPAGVTSMEISISDVSTGDIRYFSLDDICFRQTTPPIPLSLGNKVFFDKNRSGTYDVGDSVAAGMIVRLYNDANNDNVPDGSFIQAATTDGAGEYTFSNLFAGNYIVGVPMPSGHGITVINGGDPDNNIDNDNNAITLVSGEARGNAITLSAGAEPSGGGNSNTTYDFGFYNPALPPNGGQNCFAGSNPIVYAKSFWNVNLNSQTVTIRVTFSKKFVDNTYGTGAIGWPSGHTFSNLTGSDHLQWSIRDANGVEKLAFKQDYISASTAFPSGYGCLGFGGDGGNPTVGTAADVISFRSSMGSNFNDFGYVLTTNSPATDTNYVPNASQPNWIYDVWYEVTVKSTVFGTPGFGFVNVASVHASPSKTGNNTEIITNTPCVSSIGDRVWYDTDRDGIQDASENGIRGVTVKLRNAAGTVIATQVTNTTGYYLFSNLQPGNYSVEFPPTVYGYILSPAYVGTNRAIDSDPSVATGITPVIVLGTADDIRTIDAGYAPDCACTNSASNLLTNANFENGTTGWSWSNGTLTTGTGYVACGAANGFNNWSSGTSKVWQDVAVGAGYLVKFSGYAGTHAPGIACSPKISLVFLNAANTVLGQSDVTVTRVVGDYNDQLEQYSITATSPAGTTKVRVQSTITCNTMKMDAFCLTITPLIFNLSGNVWHDVNGMNDNLVNNTGPLQTPPAQAIPTGMRISRVDAVTGVVLAVALVQGNGAFNFPNVPPGDYILILSPLPGVVGQQAPFASLPPGWINTGEHLGLTPGRDAVINGKLSASVVNVDVTNCNFGIQLSNDDIGIN